MSENRAISELVAEAIMNDDEDDTAKLIRFYEGLPPVEQAAVDKTFIFSAAGL